MRKRIEETDRFSVEAPGGVRYVVVERTTFIDATTLADTQTRWRESTRQYDTTTGLAVNALDDGSFEVLDRTTVVGKRV